MKRKNDSVDILFCGLLREPEMFKASINEMVSLREKGLINKILFSTWIGEVKKNPEIEKLLKEKNVKIIESEEPKERGHGSIWCQMKAMNVGLEKIDSGRFILKTRSDVHVNKDFLVHLFNNKSELLKIKVDLPKGNIFSHKVWVPWFEITRPFYIGDECFFGKKEDVKLMINFDRRYDTDYRIGSGLAHIRRFIHPFIESYPIFKDSLGKFRQDGAIKTFAVRMKDKKIFDLRKISFLRDLNKFNRFRKLKKRLRDSDYIKVLSAYYSIMYSHFYVDGDSYPKQVVFDKAEPPSKKMDLEIMENNYTSGKTVYKYGGQIHDFNMKMINNLCENRLVQTPLSKRLTIAINRFNNGSTN